MFASQPNASKTSLRAAVTVLGVVLALGVVSTAAASPNQGPVAETSVVAHASPPEEDSDPIPESVAAPIRRARAALARAKTQIAARAYAKAVDSLRVVRVNVSAAHQAGMAQIGAPPADPESDDQPGPVSVMAVLNLEHAVMNGVVVSFNGTTRRVIVQPMRTTLWRTHVLRKSILSAVIAVDPEEGADYADGMADTLPIYANEVKVITTALHQYRLSQYGRAGLRDALARAKATRATVNAAFGGGE